MASTDNFEPVDLRGIKGGITAESAGGADVELFLIRAPANFDPSSFSGASFSFENGGTLRSAEAAAPAEDGKKRKKKSDAPASDSYVLEAVQSGTDARSALTEFSSFNVLLRSSDGTLKLGKPLKGALNVVRRLTVPSAGKPQYVRVPVKQREGLTQRWFPYGSGTPFKASAPPPSDAASSPKKKRKRTDEEAAVAVAGVAVAAEEAVDKTDKKKSKKRKGDNEATTDAVADEPVADRKKAKKHKEAEDDTSATVPAAAEAAAKSDKKKRRAEEGERAEREEKEARKSKKEDKHKRDKK